MVWRERKNFGKGVWAGPVRVLHVEASTYWLASGATLLRAKANQVRLCSRNEELVAIAGGAAVYRLAVTMETLLRGFCGKQYEDLTGSNPPEAAREDLTQGEVRVPARPRRSDDDMWEVRGRWLVRIHNKPRLALFVPTKARGLPVLEDQLDGERRTVIKAAGNEQTILDDYRKDDNPGRCLIDRWTGETCLKISATHPQGQAKEDELKPPEPREEPPESAPFDLDRGRTRQRKSRATPADRSRSIESRQNHVKVLLLDLQLKLEQKFHMTLAPEVPKLEQSQKLRHRWPFQAQDLFQPRLAMKFPESWFQEHLGVQCQSA